jgi:hypothetical protein
MPDGVERIRSIDHERDQLDQFRMNGTCTAGACNRVKVLGCVSRLKGFLEP